MKKLDLIGKELFNKVRGRFPSVTIGNEKGEVTNIPEQARFFDFEYKEGGQSLGKISISLDENTVSIMYAQDIVEDQDSFTKENWFNFLKEMRVFAKKRMLNFDTRNITKSNLNKRDYKFLAQQGGEQPMSESKLYGTSRVSYQDVGNARVTIKHTESIDQERAGGRTQKVGSIYVENADGERFKYPFKHLNGARAMARHVSEGGKPFDDFGKHITGLSEELANLKKFKTYMNRSSVMAEGLAGYVDIVKERIGTVKKTIESLQKESYYKEAFEGFEVPVMEEVPEDVKENWIDELTIRQFNEELADVFPYIYKLVSEATRAKEIGPDSLLGESEQVVEDVESWAKSLDPNTKKQFVAWARPIIKAADVNMGDDVYDLLGKEIVNSPFADTYKSWKDAKYKDVFNQLTAMEGPIDWMKDKFADFKKGREDSMKQYEQDLHILKTVLGSHGYDDATIAKIENGCLNDPRVCLYNTIRKSGAETGDMDMEVKRIGKELNSGLTTRGGTVDEEIESAFEGLMGQFAENSVNEDMDGDALRAWYMKYEDHHSYDAYGLVNGFFKYFLDSGIPTDAMEKQECFALIKKFGSEEFMEDPLGAMEKAPRLAPITTAMWAEFEQIAGPDFGEDEVHKASRMIDNIDEGIGEVSSCCEAPIQGEGAHGRCSECGEMASAIPIEEGFNDDVFEGFKKGDTVTVNDEPGYTDFSAPGVIIGLSSKGGKARVRFRNNKTEIVPIDMLSPIAEGERHGNSKIYDKCWKGYRKVPGKTAGEKGSCVKIESEQDTEEGNAYAKAVRQAKMNGAKPGDEIDGPDGKKITIEDVTEYVLSLYDRETGQFPKGETAVLTAVEKDFGEHFINPAKQFIEMINAKFEEFSGYKDPELMDSEESDIIRLAGISK